MKVHRTIPLVLLIVSSTTAQADPQPMRTAEPRHKLQTSGAAPTRSVAVYVSDFELDILHDKVTTSAPSSNPAGTMSNTLSSTAPNTPRTPPSTTQPSRTSASSQREGTPAEQANALVSAMSETLVSALEKAGYRTRRLSAGEPRPAVGMQIRGVFAEADEENRVRRLLLGGVTVTPKMLLFVGINNLARPEQPLYGFANPPSKDSRHGPVITVTSYAPVSRFELERKPSDDDLKRIAAQIAASFTALLTANPTAVTR